MAGTTKRKLTPDREGNGFSEFSKCHKAAVEPKEMTTYY
jgi:hypothetical protein